MNPFLEELNLDLSDIRRVLEKALAGGGDHADLYCETRRAGVIEMEEGIIKAASRQLFRGAGVRVFIGEQTGYAYTEDLDRERLFGAAQTAAAIASSPNGRRAVGLTPGTLQNRYPVDEPPANVPVKDKIALIQEAERAARGFDPRIRQVNVSFSEAVIRLVIATSDGRILHDERPILRFSVEAVSEKQGLRQHGRSSGGGRLGMEYFRRVKSARRHGEDAARQAIRMLDAREAPAGPMEVILAPGESGILLHESIGHPLEADFNRKGTSAYAGRIGQPVASDLCTVIDDATVSGDRGSLNFDDEGIPGCATVLIEKGVLKSYMHDRISARHFGVEPTGNGRRESYKYHPIPRMTTTYMRGGDLDPEEIIRSTKRGIYCKTFRGGQVDISNGDFVFVPAEAYRVEDGRLTAPLKNLTLIGNGPDVLTRVSMVANDLQFSDGMWTCGKGQSVPVGVGLPTVKVSEITVGGTTI